MSEEKQEKPKMCGDCRNHKGESCDKHPGKFREHAAACDDFVPKVSQPTGGAT